MDIDKLYTLLKVIMKKNHLIFRLLYSGLLVVKNPGPNASPQMKQRLASAVHHTLFEMTINNVSLRGLVNPDKEVEISRLEDENGESSRFGYNQRPPGPLKT